jgi:hypothetical protein
MKNEELSENYMGLNYRAASKHGFEFQVVADEPGNGI